MSGTFKYAIALFCWKPLKQSELGFQYKSEQSELLILKKALQHINLFHNKKPMQKNTKHKSKQIQISLTQLKTNKKTTQNKCGL
ncbi:hypothetical protein PGRAN_03485 [Listeria grandensis FSL F6-0971]|uniref:Uncharacterized protein n=1 Tax=Listeria grandensis FSL F6-0971 TaxID=1265819 RepID=W7BPD6_9LIST|nr:hypothetical protein PGRAN_03485 [Listeria grandensis FSL F6-0971]